MLRLLTVTGQRAREPENSQSWRQCRLAYDDGVQRMPARPVARGRDIRV